VIEFSSNSWVTLAESRYARTRTITSPRKQTTQQERLSKSHPVLGGSVGAELDDGLVIRDDEMLEPQLRAFRQNLAQLVEGARNERCPGSVSGNTPTPSKQAVRYAYKHAVA